MQTNIIQFQTEIYNVGIVFARIGAVFFLMPTLGETFISTRARLIFSLFVCFLVVQTIKHEIPPFPDSVIALLMTVLTEITIGIFIGLLMRLYVGALEIAGMIIAMQSSLANAFVFNPANASQGSIPGSLLTMGSLALIFAMDLHHIMIESAVDSYTVFHPGKISLIGDFSLTLVNQVAKSFVLAIKLSSPFLIAGFIVSLALGIISRFIPQIQVFFVFMPLQVGFGLALIYLTFSSMLLLWVEEFEGVLNLILGR